MQFKNRNSMIYTKFFMSRLEQSWSSIDNGVFFLGYSKNIYHRCLTSSKNMRLKPPQAILWHSARLHIRTFINQYFFILIYFFFLSRVLFLLITVSITYTNGYPFSLGDCQSSNLINFIYFSMNMATSR